MRPAADFAGLDVHARSVKAVALDAMTGEVRSTRQGAGRGLDPPKNAHRIDLSCR